MSSSRPRARLACWASVDSCVIKPARCAACTGIYLFFVFFGLGTVLLQLIFTASRFWVEGNLPKILLIARAHSISPLTILRRVLVRKARQLKRQLAHAAGLESPYVTPQIAQAIYHFRTQHATAGGAPPANTPAALVTVATGTVATLWIEGIAIWYSASRTDLLLCRSTCRPSMPTRSSQPRLTISYRLSLGKTRSSTQVPYGWKPQSSHCRGAVSWRLRTAIRQTS